MTIPGSANPLLLASAAAEPTAYEIERSVRFNSADSAYLSRTPASAGNRKTWTWAGWVKRSSGAAFLALFSSRSDDSNRANIRFNSDDKLEVSSVTSGSNSLYFLSSAVYRDYSAWYHIVVLVDTAQATDTNRLKVYVNGLQVVAGSVTYPTQNYDTFINSNLTHSIGRLELASPVQYFPGYLADIHFIDGQALDPTSFGEFDANGIWQPIEYTGSYGTNGFHLDFADNSTAAALGTDTSGNGNDWTVNNITPPDTGTTVSSATGAKPIFATTDSYGQIVGTGLATDNNASNLELCAPLTDGSGTASMTDQSPTGRTSSTLTLTNNNPLDITVNTATGNFYGESLNFSGAHSGVDVASIGIWNSDFTLEGWFRRTGTGARQTLFDTWYGQVSGVGFYIWWDGTGLDVVKDSSTYYQQGSGTALPLNTWQHIALTRSGTTIKIYVDGTQYMSFTPSDSTWTSSTLRIGDAVTNGDPFIGQIQDVRAYSSVKYTANFTVPAAPISSPNDDSLVDVPTNGTETDTGVGGEVRGNYCTLNPLSITYGSGTLANGNLELTPAGSDWTNVNSTFAITSEKVYFEATGTDTPSSSRSDNARGAWIGLRRIKSQSNWAQNGADAYSLTLNDMGYLRNGGSAFDAIGAKISSGDVVGFAYDGTNGTYEIFLNGVSKSSGSVSITSYSAGDEMYVATAAYPDSGTVYGNFALNFGQRPFAYTAPSGYKALCTANLPAPVVTKPSEYMDVALYTGNGSTQTISGLEFSPDFVWTKRRDATGSHVLVDAVRGTSNSLFTNETTAELIRNSVTSFNSDGFTLGNYVNSNTASASYVAWTWDAGDSTASNPDGSITSTVRANPSAGFSIIDFTCQSSGIGTSGHGLGVAPEFFIYKRRASASSWTVYHKSIGNLKRLLLNSTNAQSGDASTLFNSTSPSSTLITLGSAFAGNGSSIIYAFAPVEGYSAFGSYTGNGSTDGPFVYTGFRPRWVMVKRTNDAGNWTINDAARNTYNVTQNRLWANLSDAESTSADYYIDFLSNGFKLRTSAADTNASASTYIYAAFAESPFNFSRAR